MSRSVGYTGRSNASLQDYYDACNGDDSSENGLDDESDQDSPNYWRSSCRSPLRGRARLTLHQRNSVQHTLMDQTAAFHRGHDAAAAAVMLAKPLGLAGDDKAHGADDVKMTLASSSQDNVAGRLFFDALCALRQSPNGSFEVSLTARNGGPPVWSLRKGTAIAEMWEGTSFCLQTLVKGLLVGANDVSRAQWLLQLLEASLTRENGILEDVFTDYSQTCTGEEGLRLASRLALCRFCSLVHRIIQKIMNWAMKMQEEGKYLSNAKEVLKLNLFLHIEKSLLPLRRCILLLESACSLLNEGQKHPGGSISHSHSGGSKHVEVDVNVVTRASALMDYLIVRMSALQDSNTLDLYRFYMVLLVYCSWPYVLLMTSAIFGFVREIDADVWRSTIPRIFRSSFSHIRVGDLTRNDRKPLTLPTDILSLVLLCVGYEQVDTDASCRIDWEREKNWKHKRGSNRAKRRAAFASMLSSRSFILRSFVAFARQKVLTGWSRKRSSSWRPGNSEYSSCEDLLRFTQHQQQQQKREVVEGPAHHVAPTVVALPLTLCGDDHSGNGFTSSTSESFLWTLQVHDSKSYHDFLLNDCGTMEENSMNLQLWLHTSLPAARWVTASLLVPIGQVVQRLHERRLVELLSTTAVRRGLEYRTVNLVGDDYDCDDVGVDAEEEEENNLIAAKTSSRSVVPASLPYGVTFCEAVKLIIDIALCRDSERIVYTFLHRLFLEPHWWYRRDPMEYKYTGTASTFISSTFADAIRGKALAQFVRLSVAPKSETAASPQDTGNDDPAMEMLRTFASFELHFFFPWDIELILLPRNLSVSWGNFGDIEEKYVSFFWKNRRRGVGARTTTAATTRRTPSETAEDDGRKEEKEERGGRVKEQINEDGLSPRDNWSYAFGYLCSLHYAQISLQEQRKRLQQRESVSYNIMTALGNSEQGKHHSVRVTRGLGSAYFELAFAVDSLLRFTQNIASSVARELEGELTRLGTVNSCIALCRRVDTLLLRLHSVCFPVGARLHGTSPAADSLPIRDSITSVLAIALNPTSLPLRHITSRTQNAIEALVAVVRGLPVTSVVKEKMKPLLVLLTFNRFYGE